MSGYILSESLTLPELNHPAPNLLVGCASESEGYPQGVGLAGFWRVPSSLVSQLKITKFFHCIVSKLYEGHHNVTNATWENSDCFVNVANIVVGGVEVEVPQEYLTVDEAGNGGLMVEAGNRISVMDIHVQQGYGDGGLVFMPAVLLC
ncbi:Unknown protein [Striga hermonthica]|uniref:Uncharacterized protein n=1 Tax=Striga hermonthica TaxID=68872 RepID=A0A9N7MUB0_STRHE|nr:Unknown protein [Striga hermonthica]